MHRYIFMYCLRNGEIFKKIKNLNKIDRGIFIVYIIKRH